MKLDVKFSEANKDLNVNFGQVNVVSGRGTNADLSNYYTKKEVEAQIQSILGDVSTAFDDLHQLALSYQIGDIESAMQSLTEAVDGLESEVSGE